MTKEPAFKPRPVVLEPALQQHLDTLGFTTVSGYKRWCYQNGFSTNLDKTSEDFQAECDLAHKNTQGPQPSKHHRPVQAEQITYIYKNQISNLKAKGFLQHYANAFNELADDQDSRNALYHLLIHIEKYTGLFYGLKRRRYLIPTFIRLAKLHKRWVRPVDTWFPESADQTKEFGDFVRHLLAQYDIPRFLDKVWLRDPHAPDVQCFQDWYLHIASGKNIRTAKQFTVNFTKRMAHLFLQAPKYYNIEHALRWAQVTALGGSDDLVKAVYRTRLGKSFENEDFWFTVIQFFINNPMLDPAQVGPIVDYIHNQKYAPQEILQPGGGVIQGPPPHPNFTMKGRSADKLVRLVEEWHGDLAAEDYVAWKEWHPADIRPFEHTETTDTGQQRTWTIHELCTSWELAIEGKALHHCVRSYAGRCATGKASIWSTQVRIGDENPLPVMTIAVDNLDKRITQNRGKYNMMPNTKMNTSKRHDLNTSYIALLNEAPRIMRLWMEREQLKRS